MACKPVLCSELTDEDGSSFTKLFDEIGESIWSRKKVPENIKRRLARDVLGIIRREVETLRTDVNKLVEEVTFDYEAYDDLNDFSGSHILDRQIFRNEIRNMFLNTFFELEKRACTYAPKSIVDRLSL